MTQFGKEKMVDGRRTGAVGGRPKLFFFFFLLLYNDVKRTTPYDATGARNHLIPIQSANEWWPHLSAIRFRPPLRT